MGWSLLLHPNSLPLWKQYIQKEQVERIVIGKPTQPNGQPSENLARVENFFNRWRKAHPEVPIEYYDERFTSVLAHRAMIEGGVKKKTRRENKGLVDEYERHHYFTRSFSSQEDDFTYLYIWSARFEKSG